MATSTPPPAPGEVEQLLASAARAFPGAKLSIADSYYKEGGSANLTQAVAGYKDFIVFFPFLPEAPYAQIQVAMTHYKQMEKPDRDRTDAKAAEEEFQTFLAKYPKDPLAPKAEQHLREVQEVLKFS
jgi:outer membrane protein assembly factor BamD